VRLSGALDIHGPALASYSLSASKLILNDGVARAATVSSRRGCWPRSATFRASVFRASLLLRFGVPVWRHYRNASLYLWHGALWPSYGSCGGATLRGMAALSCSTVRQYPSRCSTNACCRCGRACAAAGAGVTAINAWALRAYLSGLPLYHFCRLYCSPLCLLAWRYLLALAMRGVPAAFTLLRHISFSALCGTHSAAPAPLLQYPALLSGRRWLLFCNAAWTATAAPLVVRGRRAAETCGFCRKTSLKTILTLLHLSFISTPILPFLGLNTVSSHASSSSWFLGGL